MADVDRDAVVAAILGRLQESSFRKLLAVAPDGTRPILPALLSDTFASVLKEAHVAGGIANLVVPVSNGYFVVQLRTSPAAAHEIASKPALRADCTVGVLLARLIQDGPENSYVVLSPCDGETARANLAGVAA